MTDEEGYRICHVDGIIGSARSPHPDLTKEIAEGVWIPIHTASVTAARRDGKIVFYGEGVCRNDASEPMIKGGMYIHILVSSLADVLTIHTGHNHISLAIPDDDEIPIVVLETVARIGDDGEYQYEEAPLFASGECNTGYRIIKFFSPTQRDFEYQRNVLDDPIFRYAEVLLNFAEAKAELGEISQQDLDISVNLLRDRVGMPHMKTNIDFVDPNWPDWEVPIEPLINEIRRERRIELAVEGFRFDDLRRWKAGKLVTNPKTYLGARDPATNNYRVLYPGRESRPWDDKNYLYPLPLNELTMNNNLTQNPGWKN